MNNSMDLLPELQRAHFYMKDRIEEAAHLRLAQEARQMAKVKAKRKPNLITKLLIALYQIIHDSLLRITST